LEDDEIVDKCCCCGDTESSNVDEDDACELLLTRAPSFAVVTTGNPDSFPEDGDFRVKSAIVPLDLLLRNCGTTTAGRSDPDLMGRELSDLVAVVAVVLLRFAATAVALLLLLLLVLLVVDGDEGRLELASGCNTIMAPGSV
jgi:hypothetical protein